MRPRFGCFPGGAGGGGGGTGRLSRLPHHRRSPLSTGPTWRGLFGSEVRLVDGRTVTADEEYLERSIVDPSAEVVDGYRPVMPTDLGERLTEEDIQALIAYLRSLS